MAHIELSESSPPGMRGLLGFKPATGAAVSDFVEHLLRGPGPLPPAWRELIGAHVSARNDCAYCNRAHAATADALPGPDPAEEPDPRLAALLDLADAVAESGRAVTAERVAAARATGLDDEAVHDAVLIAAAFCMLNRYVDGLGAATPDDPEFYRRTGVRLAEHGYRMT